ncbi:MAG: GtrA family protein [Paludibacteraceae bacterium]|nr:GtrA family protein [Paludibacteraceae bacterium]MBO7316355.1 GtrA family protein [Paludibacteraceae bacterium]
MAGNTLTNWFVGKTNKFFVQLFRYFFSGGIAFLIDKALFALLRYGRELNVFVSTSVGFIVGLVVTYLLSIFWIFDKRRLENRRKEFLIFVLIGIIGLLLMNVLVWFFREIVGLQFDFVSNLAATVVVTLWNFFAKKYILFH